MPKDPSAILTGSDFPAGLPEDIFAPIDLHFARFIMRISNSKKRELALAAALVSRLGSEGHTCLDLNSPLGSVSVEDVSGPDMDLPDPVAWIAALRAEPVVGTPGEFRPLILDAAGRLYFHRAFMEERMLAEKLLNMNAQKREFDENRLRESMKGFFREAEPPQKIAALMAATRSLCVITGGPGTGKTTLVCRILALLLDMEPNLKIALAAPTGKAARRIAESIQAGTERLDCPAGLKEKIPHEASTLHRLLGFSTGSTRPRYRMGNPLNADVVVIDEASMADLALMANLVQALKEGSRLILLGDRNQLASVAAGYVLGDICDTGRTHAYSKDFAGLAGRVAGCKANSAGLEGMQDSLVELTRTYRFREDSPIFTLSAAVNEGDAAKSREILRSCSGDGLCARGLPRPEALRQELQDAIISGYKGFLSSNDPGERLNLFDTFRVLCPVREGPYGVKAMNRLIQDILAASGLLEPAGLHYSGRPILVTENDYSLRLFNGDTGTITRDEGGELRACFHDKDGMVRMISPMRLPAHETAFAMTVHKSQGSEFDRVMLVLPDRDSPVLTRELIYTAITRARVAIEIRTDHDVFARSVERRTLRSSGLNDLLWGPRHA